MPFGSICAHISDTVASLTSRTLNLAITMLEKVEGHTAEIDRFRNLRNDFQGLISSLDEVYQCRLLLLPEHREVPVPEMVFNVGDGEPNVDVGGAVDGTFRAAVDDGRTAWRWIADQDR